MTEVNLEKTDIELVAYDSSEPIGLSLALGPSMTVGRCSCSSIITCCCGDIV